MLYNRYRFTLAGAYTKRIGKVFRSKDTDLVAPIQMQIRKTWINISSKSVLFTSSIRIQSTTLLLLNHFIVFSNNNRLYSCQMPLYCFELCFSLDCVSFSSFPSNIYTLLHFCPHSSLFLTLSSLASFSIWFGNAYALRSWWYTLHTALDGSANLNFCYSRLNIFRVSVNHTVPQRFEIYLINHEWWSLEWRFSQTEK